MTGFPAPILASANHKKKALRELKSRALERLCGRIYDLINGLVITSLPEIKVK